MAGAHLYGFGLSLFILLFTQLLYGQAAEGTEPIAAIAEHEDLQVPSDRSLAPDDYYEASTENQAEPYPTHGQTASPDHTGSEGPASTASGDTAGNDEGGSMDSINSEGSSPFGMGGGDNYNCHQECGDKFSSVLSAAMQAQSHYERLDQVCSNYNETLNCMAQLPLCSNQEGFDILTSGLYYMCVEQRQAFDAVIECVDAQAPQIQKACDDKCHTQAKLANWAVQSGMVDSFLSQFTARGRRKRAPPPGAESMPGAAFARRGASVRVNPGDLAALRQRFSPDLFNEALGQDIVMSGNGVEELHPEIIEGLPPRMRAELDKVNMVAIPPFPGPAPVNRLDEAVPIAKGAGRAGGGEPAAQMGDMVEEPFEGGPGAPNFQPNVPGANWVEDKGGNPEFMRTLLQEGCDLTSCHLGCMRAHFDESCGEKAGTLLAEAFVRPIAEAQKLLSINSMSPLLYAFVPQQCDFIHSEQALSAFRIDPRDDEALRRKYSGGSGGNGSVVDEDAGRPPLFTNEEDVNGTENAAGGEGVVPGNNTATPINAGALEQSQFENDAEIKGPVAGDAAAAASAEINGAVDLATTPSNSPSSPLNAGHISPQQAAVMKDEERPSGSYNEGAIGHEAMPASNTQGQSRFLTVEGGKLEEMLAGNSASGEFYYYHPFPRHPPSDLPTSM